jgi:hypothetical protein
MSIAYSYIHTQGTDMSEYLAGRPGIEIWATIIDEEWRLLG